MQPLCSSNLCNNTHHAFTKSPVRRKEENSRSQQQKQSPNTVHFLASPLNLVAAAALLTLSSPSFANPPVSIAEPVVSEGAALFQKACIGCHDMGGNILQPVKSYLNSISKFTDSNHFYLCYIQPTPICLTFQGATLFTKDLERNGVATEEDVYNITYYGKGRMPGFGEKCTPRGQCTFGPRLQEEEIKQLAEFVKLQAEKGWPKIESYGD